MSLLGPVGIEPTTCGLKDSVSMKSNTHNSSSNLQVKHRLQVTIGSLRARRARARDFRRRVGSEPVPDEPT